MSEKTSDKRPLPCPFCGVKLELIKREKGDIYHHPWNECIAKAWYFDAHNARCLKLWNARKPMEKIVERLEEEILEQLSDDGNDWFTSGKIYDAIKIVKEEGGIC